MTQDDRGERAAALLAESLDLYASVVGVCRARPEDRAFLIGILRIDVATFDGIAERWRRRMERDPGIAATFEALARDYEWSFVELERGAVPVVE
ncbi:MAG: hypothetical protein U0414_41925 [Polyangiaceae bacterium]